MSSRSRDYVQSKGNAAKAGESDPVGGRGGRPRSEAPLATRPCRLTLVRTEKTTVQLGWQPAVFFAEQAYDITRVAIVCDGDSEVNSYLPNGQPSHQRLQGDHVWIIRSGCRHALRLRREAFLVFCDFDPVFARKVEGEISDGARFLGAPLANFVRRNPLISELLREVRYEYDSGDDANSEHMATIGGGLGSSVLRVQGTPPPVAVGIRRLPSAVEDQIREFVSDHLLHDATSREKRGPKAISPQALARRAHLSPGQFGRRWKATTGLTPEQFVQQSRLLLARELLMSGDLTVSEVADNAGFSDHSYFSVQFKRRFGVTPRDFAIHHLAKTS